MYNTVGNVIKFNKCQQTNNRTFLINTCLIGVCIV